MQVNKIAWDSDSKTCCRKLNEQLHPALPKEIKEVVLDFCHEAANSPHPHLKQYLELALPVFTHDEAAIVWKKLILEPIKHSRLHFSSEQQNFFYPELTKEEKIENAKKFAKALLYMEKFVKDVLRKYENQKKSIKFLTEWGNAIDKVIRFTEEWDPHKLCIEEKAQLIQMKSNREEELKVIRCKGFKNFLTTFLPANRQSKRQGKPKLYIYFLSVTMRYLYGEDSPKHEYVKLIVNSICKTNYSAKDIETKTRIIKDDAFELSALEVLDYFFRHKN